MKILTSLQIRKLSQKELVAYAIELYNNDVPVADVVEATGVTRTRLYNNLAKQGLAPNRQLSSVRVESEAAEKQHKETVDSLREEIGVLKYLLREKESEVEDLWATVSELKKRVAGKAKTTSIEAGTIKVAKRKKIQ
mgnify:CR=1 FL=1|tara:strand:- start:13581 stop:13991 length:411 start_codon:yes stop_codon:yes gene_type:complete